MKTPIAITLIIAGSLPIAAPIVADYLHRAQLAAAMQASHATQVTLGEALSEEYSVGCWLVGVLMISAAIFSSRSSERT